MPMRGHLPHSLRDCNACSRGVNIPVHDEVNACRSYSERIQAGDLTRRAVRCKHRHTPPPSAQPLERIGHAPMVAAIYAGLNQHDTASTNAL